MNDQAVKTVPNPAPGAPTPLPPLTVLPEAHPGQPRASKPKTRNGKIARLPKLERDMVNRMLADAIPHDKIAQALAERGFKVTPRNVSNWATRGGYRQWALDQALVLETRLQQDTLTDFLRDDPTRLPEVGLQIMATRFSQLILNSADADPRQSFPLIAMLCRVSNEILKLHKFRLHRSFPGNPGWRAHHESEQAKKDVENLRRAYSGEPVENEPPPPAGESLGQFLQLLRSAVAPPQAAAAPSVHQSPQPPSVVSSKPTTGHSQPVTTSVRPVRKSKPKTSHSPPTPSASVPLSTLSPQLSTPNDAAESSFSVLPSSFSEAPPDAPPSVSSTVGSAKVEALAKEGLPSEGLAEEGHVSRITHDASPSVIEITPLQTPLRFIDSFPQPPPPQHCPNCRTPLEYFRDGSPPATNCPKCIAALDNLYGNAVKRCPACSHPLPPLLPSGLRPRRVCAVCGCGLPTPKTPGPHPPPLKQNARFCMYCRTPIPRKSEGVPAPIRCAKCQRYLPRIIYSTFETASSAAGDENFSSA